MFVNKDSIIIDGISMGQYLLAAKYQYPKLWGSDTGRNLAGQMTGTLIGVFPKFTLTFRKLTREEMNIIAPILDEEVQTITYYDPSLNRNVTLDTYSGDWEYDNKQIVTKNESFECSFIALEKRS